MAGSGWDVATAGSGVAVVGDGTAERPTDGGGGLDAGIRGVAGRAKGKRYFEVNIGAETSCSIGVVDENADLEAILGGGSVASQWGALAEDGYLYSRDTDGAESTDMGSGSFTGVVGILIDFDNKSMTVFDDGVEIYSATISFASDTTLYPAVSMGVSSSGIELQTVEPFSFPPEFTFVAWDAPDSALSAKISGVIEIDGTPVARMLKAFTYERLTYSVDGSPVTESKPLGQTVSDAESGEYEIILRDGFARDIFVVAFDEYGEAFENNAEIAVGERIHPLTPNGYVYECDGSGTLPSSEPIWTTDTEQSQSVGTASVRPFPFYRPQVHGPLVPEKVEGLWDPSWGNVVALLMMEGTNNSTAFLDATAKRSWSAVGNAKITTADSYFGSSCGVFDGSGDAIETPDHNDFNFGAGDFTIEGFINPGSGYKSGYRAIICQRTNNNSNHSFNVNLQVGTGDLFFVMTTGGAATDAVYASAGSPPEDVWSHFAVSRVGNQLRVFVAGNGGTIVNVAGKVMFNSPVSVLIGAADSGVYSIGFLGKMDAFRITKGVGRYLDNFTPPTYYPEQ